MGTYKFIASSFPFYFSPLPPPSLLIYSYKLTFHNNNYIVLYRLSFISAKLTIIFIFSQFRTSFLFVKISEFLFFSFLMIINFFIYLLIIYLYLIFLKSCISDPFCGWCYEKENNFTGCIESDGNFSCKNIFFFFENYLYKKINNENKNKKKRM